MHLRLFVLDFGVPPGLLFPLAFSLQLVIAVVVVVGFVVFVVYVNCLFLM